MDFCKQNLNNQLLYLSPTELSQLNLILDKVKKIKLISSFLFFYQINAPIITKTFIFILSNIILLYLFFQVG